MKYEIYHHQKLWSMLKFVVDKQRNRQTYIKNRQRTDGANTICHRSIDTVAYIRNKVIPGAQIIEVNHNSYFQESIF